MEKKELTITEKQMKGLKVLQVVNKQVCCKELITKNKELVKEQGFDTQKVNALNATLASLATKGLVEKEPKQFGDKLLTHYSLTEKGLSLLNKEENN